MRLIDTDAIKLPKGFFESVDNVPKFYEWLNTLPTIEPKRGMWEKISDRYYKCSCCNAWWSVDRESIINEFKYCPDCGAKMDGLMKK